MAHSKPPSFGLVSRVRVGDDGLNRTIIQDTPWVRAAVQHLRSAVVDAGLLHLNAKFLREMDTVQARATLWATIVIRGMDAPEGRGRDPATLCALHGGGMGLLLELGWPNVFIIEESSMVFHFRRVEGSPAEASQSIEAQIREYLAGPSK